MHEVTFWEFHAWIALGKELENTFVTADIGLFKILGAGVIVVVTKAERGIWVDTYIAELFYKFKVQQANFKMVSSYA